MKLFQKLLLAPAAIGLFAPIAASASEANLKDVSNYSQVDIEVSQDTFKPLSTKNPLLAGGEGLGQDLVSDFDGDSFSSTTSASFAVNWAFGSVDGLNGGPNEDVNREETVGNNFDWSLSTVTSFTGDDSLDVTLQGGNGGNHLRELDLASGTSVIVDSISYTRNVGEYVAYAFGFGVDGSTLYNTACVYEAQTNVLGKCGLTAALLDMDYGTNAGIAVDVGNGLSVAFGYEGEGTTQGLLSEEGADGVGAQVAYVKDSYGVSITFSQHDNATLSTTNGDQNWQITGDVTSGTALNGFIVPSVDGFPSISFGYEWKNDGSVNDENADQFTNYFVGFQFDELGNGSLGAAVGSKEAAAENIDHQTMWEAYYSYNYADGVKITPLVYYKENSAQNTDDETGIIVKTSFEF